MKDTSERISQPSFGQIYFSRCSGRADFYGSELTHDHYITMEVLPSELERSLTSEWYFEKRLPLIKVRMTATQFAEAITSLNYGSGVPCTVEMVDGKKVEPFKPIETRKENIHREFKNRMKDFGDTIRDRQTWAKELVKKKTLSKQDIHDLTHHLEWLTMEVEQNIPFFMECFQETVDKVVVEAKNDVEAAIQHKINVLGLEKLHEQNKLLSDNNDTL